MTAKPSRKASGNPCEAPFGPWQVARVGSGGAATIGQPASPTKVDQAFPNRLRAVGRMTPSIETNDNRTASSPLTGCWPRVFPGL
jgi:hypothetical protein